MRPLAARMSVMSGEGALSVFAHAKELERQGHSVIHLELGEPDFHPAAPVKEALKRALDEGKERYCPVLGVPALREAIAAYLKKTRNLDVSSANENIDHQLSGQSHWDGLHRRSSAPDGRACGEA